MTCACVRVRFVRTVVCLPSFSHCCNVLCWGNFLLFIWVSDDYGIKTLNVSKITKKQQLGYRWKQKDFFFPNGKLFLIIADEFVNLMELFICINSTYFNSGICCKKLHYTWNGTKFLQSEWIPNDVFLHPCSATWEEDAMCRDVPNVIERNIQWLLYWSNLS